MTDFAELATRVTRRLGRDPELQREVCRELQSHLEDSAAENVAAGMKDEEAKEAAGQSLGPEDELAEQLWQANRGRIGLRQTAKWAAGVVVIPAVFALSAWVLWGALTSVLLMFSLGSVFGGSGSSRPPETGLAGVVAAAVERTHRDLLGSLTEEQRDLLGHPTGTKSQLDVARELAQKQPEDRVVWANYALAALRAATVTPVDRTRPLADSIRQTTDVFDQGKKIDPDNAFYPLLKAALLARISTIEPGANSTPVLAGFDGLPVQGKRYPVQYEVYTVTDRAIFEQAMRELHEAAAKPTCRTYIWDFACRKLNSLGTASSLGDVILRVELQASTLLPHLYEIKELMGCAGTEAIGLAERGNEAGAKEVLRDARQTARLLAQDTWVFVELLVARGIYDATFFDEAIVEHRLGHPEKRDRAMVRSEAGVRSRHGIEAPDRSWLSEQAGRLDQTLMPAYTDPARVNLEPGRRLDYLLADRAFVSTLLTLGVGIVLAAGSRVVATKLRTGTWPAVAFIGWGGLARIALLSTLLPVVVFGVYVCLPWISGRGVSNLSRSFDRVVIEYSMVFCLMVVLFRILTARALGARAAVLNAPELRPELPGLAMRVVGCLLGLLCMAYLAGGSRALRAYWPDLEGGVVLSLLLSGYVFVWIIPARTHRLLGTLLLPLVTPLLIWGLLTLLVRHAGQHTREQMATAILCLMIASFAAVVIVLVARLLRGRQPDPAIFSAGLSMVPGVIASMLVLAGVALPLLRLEERRTARALTTPAETTLIMGELDRNSLRVWTEQMARE